MKSFRLLLCVAVGAGVFGGLAPLVDAESGAANIIEEIVVTARKRDDTLQDVPLSVTAFTAEQLQRRQFQDLQDIAQETSGLVYENYATAGLSTAAVIRSMGQTFTTARVQNTAVFLDGVYLQRQSMINPGLMDLERVEVVKGPQNAQFGRNAFSGVVHYITKKPSDELSGSLTATYGAHDRLDVRGGISIPLVEDRLSLRLAAGTSEYDGHTKNHHPFAESGPGGSRATDDRVGGWDDEFYTAAFRWTPTDELEVNASYFQTKSIREPQAFYNLNGARYAYDTAEFAGPPTFRFLAPLGANCLNTATFSSRAPFPAVGPHAWCGKLPSSVPELPDAKLQAGGFGGTSGQIVIDPRSLALDSNSKVAQFNFNYDMTEALSLNYQFGWVDHQADNFGTAEGRASLVGSSVAYAPVQATPFPPFLTQLGPPGSFGAIAHASTFNANPSEALEATSHEFRLTRSTENLTMRIGLYYSENDDDDGGTFYFLSPCNSEANCGVRVADGSNPLMGRYLAVVPIVPGAVHIGIPHLYDTGHGVLGNHTAFEDKVTALFGDVEWQVSDQVTIALEARYTWEKKSFEQFSTTFGLPMPGNVDSTDDEKFTFFTPRAILQWRPTDSSMLYGLIAKGVKTGGFNAVDPTANPGQAVYDEEKNWTFEVGSKNRFMDDRLTLNVAAYFIDWKNVQGTEAATSADAWTTDVVGNIGDAEVTGFEVDGLLVATDNIYIDYHLAFSDAEYQDAVYLSAVAGPRSSWGCNNTVCRADGRVDGNRVERTSKWQYGAGLNFTSDVGGGWRFDARIDFNYRGRMYATPLNLAHNGGRTLSNANISLVGGDLDISLWSRNIFDKKYVANSFVLPSFTRYIVGLGARRTIGLTVSYRL